VDRIFLCGPRWIEALGRFLHASLQLDALQDCASIYDVEKTLEEFPPRIEDVYKRTWTRILDQTPRMVLLAKNVLIWVLCATRSLTAEELCRAVATCPETYKFEQSRRVDEATLMGLCRGLVNIEEETNVVRFVREFHASPRTTFH
jgi:ankyrin repeat domain-containing protein 50